MNFKVTASKSFDQLPLNQVICLHYLIIACIILKITCQLSVCTIRCMVLWFYFLLEFFRVHPETKTVWRRLNPNTNARKAQNPQIHIEWWSWLALNNLYLIYHALIIWTSRQQFLLGSQMVVISPQMLRQAIQEMYIDFCIISVPHSDKLYMIHWRRSEGEGGILREMWSVF